MIPDHASLPMAEVERLLKAIADECPWCDGGEVEAFTTYRCVACTESWVKTRDPVKTTKREEKI